MIRLQIFEAGSFTALALAVHLALFAAVPRDAGVAAAGSGGAEVTSLRAASTALARQVAQYDSVPEPTPTIDAPRIETPPTPAPVAPPQIDLPQMDRPSLPQAAPSRTSAPKPPQPPQTMPERPPEPVAAPKLRPTPLQKPAPKPAPKPRRAQDHDSAAQRAAGSGGGTAAGRDGIARDSALAAGQERNLRLAWGAAIRTRIERAKRYPPAAGWARGEATLRLNVTRGGQLAGVRLLRSSGSAALDAAAIEAVRRAGRFPPAPAGLSGRAYAFSLTIRFAR